MKVDIDLWNALAAFNPFFGDGSNNWAEVAETLIINHNGILLDGETLQGEDQRTTHSCSYFKGDDSKKIVQLHK